MNVMSGQETTRDTPSDGEATVLLSRIQAGSEEAASKLFELLRTELHRVASNHMRGAKAGHTLQATALVHEAWIRLMGGETRFANRDHFLAVAARAMRSVLVDHARRSKALKRGGDHVRVPIDLAFELYDQRAHNLIELDDALRTLAMEEERQAKVVELRFFAGLTIEATASVLGVSPATVERDWRLARIWLLDQIEG